MLTLILTITMLMYTVMAVFMMVFLALLLPGLWLFERRSVAAPHSFADPTPGARRPIYAIALAALAALVIATLVYYGQYIPLIIERTLPYFFGGNTGQKAGIQNHQPFLEYLADYIPRLGYISRSVVFGLWVPLVLSFIGLLR